MFADFERIASVLENLPEKRLAIAFSGGVDSVTLARASEIVLGKENVLFHRKLNAPLLWNGQWHANCSVLPYRLNR